MKTVLMIVILIIICIPLVMIRMFIRRKIREGTHNLVNKAAANIRDKQHQKEGQQNLADRYNQNDH